MSYYLSIVRKTSKLIILLTTRRRQNPLKLTLIRDLYCKWYYKHVCIDGSDNKLLDAIFRRKTQFKNWSFFLIQENQRFLLSASVGLGHDDIVDCGCQSNYTNFSKSKSIGSTAKSSYLHLESIEWCHILPLVMLGYLSRTVPYRHQKGNILKLDVLTNVSQNCIFGL